MATLFWIFVGYCIAVLFPIPYLSPLIITGWKKILGITKPFIEK